MVLINRNCCATLQSCVWLHTAFVCQYEVVLSSPCVYFTISKNAKAEGRNSNRKGCTFLVSWNPKVSLPAVRLRPLILIFRFVSFSKIHFNITLPSHSFPTVVLNAFLIIFACYMSRPCYRRITDFDIIRLKLKHPDIRRCCAFGRVM